MENVKETDFFFPWWFPLVKSDMVQYIFGFYSGFESLKAQNPDGLKHF